VAVSFCERLRGRRRRHSSAAVPAASPPHRVTANGEKIAVDLLRAFLKRTLEDDAVADPVNDLLFDHIVAGRLHPSVVAENLPTHINATLSAATREDWQAVADELIAEAREANGEV
jgi:aminoglycoside/choline kinase family phosphotransferase